MIRLSLPIPAGADPQAVCAAEMEKAFGRSDPLAREVLLSAMSHVGHRIAEYVVARGNPEHIADSTFDRRDGSTGTYLFDRYRSGSGVDSVIVPQVDASFRGYCPYCGLPVRRKPDERHIDRDHVLPRSMYPEFSILRLNLVLSCDDCNGHKGSKVKDDQGRWLFVHPYFDDFLSTPIVQVELNVTDALPLFKFGIRPGAGGQEHDRLVRHFEELDLNARYCDELSRQLPLIAGNHQVFIARGADLAASRAAFEDTAGRALAERPNDPVGLACRELAATAELGRVLEALAG